MIKRLHITALIILCTFAAIFAQNHTIVFYNVENFFDTINDPNTDDKEFTPKGKKRWTSQKYHQKLTNIERVFADIANANGDFPTVIGLSEVETKSILEDIASTKSMAAANYKIVHYDSPEERGVDVAFLYCPDQFKIEGSHPVKTIIPNQTNFATRDILTVWGKIEEQDFFFMVVHWPSRWSGTNQSEYLRISCATQMRQIVDSVSTIRPDTKFILMGDFNDDPNDKSITDGLKAKSNIEKLEKGDLYNPFYDMLMAGYGTLAYNDIWNIFDNIIISENLINAPSAELKLQKSIYNSQFYANIFKPSYLIQQEGRFKGYPFRSFSRNKWMGGYSDHLPVFINIECEAGH